MRRDLLLVEEMIDAAERAHLMVSGLSLSDLEADTQRRDALLWNFTVLGEAASQLDASTRDRFPEVAWVRPIGLRNRIVHGYWSIDLEIIHTTACDLLPDFLSQLRRVRDTLASEG